MKASLGLKMTLCEHLKYHDLNIESLEKIKERLKTDLLALDKFIENKMEVSFSIERDCYVISKNGQEKDTSDRRENALDKLRDIVLKDN